LLGSAGLVLAAANLVTAPANFSAKLIGTAAGTGLRFSCPQICTLRPMANHYSDHAAINNAANLAEHWLLCRCSALPPETPAWITPALVALTIRVWQPYYSEVITPVTAITMVRSAGRLFDVLRESREAICCVSQS
jgi:hypothetical protein